MTYIILQPHSNTNPTERHLVVESGELARYENGDALPPAYTGQFGSYPEAVALQDKLNAAEPETSKPAACSQIHNYADYACTCGEQFETRTAQSRHFRSMKVTPGDPFPHGPHDEAGFGIGIGIGIGFGIGIGIS